MSVLDDPEEKQKKKLRKCAKNASYGVGGAVGLWILQALWPEKEGAEKLSALFGDLALCLLVYGVVVLTVIMLRRNWALRVNALMTWLVVPAWVVVLLMQASGGP